MNEHYQPGHSVQQSRIARLFLILIAVLLTMIAIYWFEVLNPRFRAEAESHAHTLAQSQTNILSQTLTTQTPDELHAALMQDIDWLLLFLDPNTGSPFVKGIELEIDYDTIDAETGSLDITAGNIDCKTCFISEIPIYDSNSRELLGIAIFYSSSEFYHRTRNDIGIRLLIGTMVGLAFLIVLWRSITNLIGQLNISNRELSDAKQHLEDRVKQRTEQLNALNIELTRQMKLRNRMEEALRSLRQEEDLRQRKKLAAELHDVLSQSMQAIKLELQMHHASLDQGNDINTEDLTVLIDEINTVSQQIRQMSSELRPVFLDSMDIVQAIELHADKINQLTGISINVTKDRDVYELDNRVKEYCFLIFQETLNNVVKHAEAKRVEVKLLQADDDWIQLEIKDDGKGFKPEILNNDGLGLSLIKDRTHDIGGTLDINTNPGSGTQLMIKVPMKMNTGHD